jgi:hypothetical protein
VGEPQQARVAWLSLNGPYRSWARVSRMSCLPLSLAVSVGRAMDRKRSKMARSSCVCSSEEVS